MGAVSGRSFQRGARTKLRHRVDGRLWPPGFTRNPRSLNDYHHAPGFRIQLQYRILSTDLNIALVIIWNYLGLYMTPEALF